MAHVLIVGRTMTGKSALIKQIGSQLRRQGEEVLAFNPLGGDGFTKRDKYGCAAAEWESDDPDKFGAEVARRVMQKQKRRWLAIDEAHEFFDRGNSKFLWMGTKGRHNGLNLILATQRAALLNPTVRGQCGELYLFGCSLTDARFLSDEYGNREIATATELKPGEYYRLYGNQLTRGAVFTSD